MMVMVSDQCTTATNGGDGSNEISLRNLGAGRTLVLVDGRRWVTDAFGAVDMNTIPAFYHPKS